MTARMATAPAPSFDHIVAMTDARGTFEHADHASPRTAHGYCTDDMARLLVVTARQPEPDGVVLGLMHAAFGFLAAAQGADGKVRNRLTPRGRWKGRRSVEDCWGRTVWAFGTVVARSEVESLRPTALAHFDRSAAQRSPWPRSMAFAALGAAEVLAVAPSHQRAIDLLDDAAQVIGRARADRDWPWPERRLTYANAVLPEAMLAIGSALHRGELVADGLRLLEWLITRQTNRGHLSLVPVGGAGPDDGVPRFDQQPIEAAALADACARAAEITGSPVWTERLDRVVDWFLGDNDASRVMLDPATGGGYDGLTADGPNLNQGAESTLALISVLQHRQRLTVKLQ